MALRPQVVERDRILVRVHAVPESRVPECVELTISRQPPQRRVLEHAVLLQVGEEPRLEHEEAPVHPVVQPGLLLEGQYSIVLVQLSDAELAAWPYNGHRGESAVAAVEGAQRRQTDPPPSRRVQSRVEAIDLNGLGPRSGGHELLDRLAQIPGQQQEAPK